MQEAEITQQELSNKIGKKQQIISNWITGYRKPKLENLQKIASATGKPISYFLDNTCGAVGNKNIVVSGKNNVVANNDIDLIKKELSEVKKQLHEMILIIKNKK